MQLRELFQKGTDDSLGAKLRVVVFTVTKETFGEALNDLSPDHIKIEHPKNENYGDYSSNIALIMAGKLRMKPFDIVNKIKERLDDYIKTHKTITVKADSKILSDYIITVSDILEKVEVAGQGFLNLTIRTDYITTQLSQLLNRRNGVRTIQIDSFFPLWPIGMLKGRKIFIEFAHPNTHKEFHIGHLRNISIGESLVRILQANGADVFRANYEGDVGLHVAKAIWGVKSKVKSEKLKVEELRKLKPGEKAKFLGAGYALGSKAYEEDEEAKKEIIELNKSIYTDPQKVELWDETRRWSLEYFDTVYRRVGTYFDRLFFESEVEKDGREIVKRAAKEGIFVQDTDGSIYFPGEKYGLNNCVFVTREDYATYEGKEIALEELEYATFPYDLSINVVAHEQTNFFQLGYKATEVLYPHHKEKHFHLAYGMVQLKSGKMSSRTGEVITADWLFDQAKEKIKEIIQKNKEQKNLPPTTDEIEQISEIVAVAAVKYSMLRVNPLMDIAFDLQESVSLEGDSGPYLLYTYARCRSVLRKAQGKQQKNLPLTTYLPRRQAGNLQPNSEESSLLHTLHRFPEIVSEAGRTLSPNLLCSYLFDLAQKYNLFYNKHTILGKDFRLFLTEVTASIIQEGLSLLGIATVERM